MHALKFQDAVEAVTDKVTDTMEESEGPVFAHMASADQGNIPYSPLKQALNTLLAQSIRQTVLRLAIDKGLLSVLSIP